MSNQRYAFYRYDNTDGSSKDWAVRDHGDGTYTSRWGKTGAKLQSKTFQNMLPMQDHISEKLRKGYKYIGEFFIDDDGKLSTEQPGSLIGTTTNDSRIYWRIRIPSTLANSPHLPFLKGWSAGQALILSKAFPDCPWIKEVVNGHGDFVQNNAGSLLKEAGVAPLLWLMAIKRRAECGITISMSHEDGVEISSDLRKESEVLSFFGVELESIREIAERIGLLEKRVDLSQIASEQADFYF